MKEIKVGLLIDDMIMPAWIGEMLRLIDREEGVRICLIVRNGTLSRQVAAEQRSPLPATKTVAIGHRFLYDLWMTIDKHRFASERGGCSMVDLSAALAGIPVIDVLPEHEEQFDSISAADAQKIAQYQMDVLLQVGFRTLHGDILTAATCGVWRYRYGSVPASSDLAPCAWEVLLNRDVTECILEIAGGDITEGSVLYRSWSPTDSISPVRTLERMVWKTCSFVPRRLRELQRIGPNAFLEKYKKPGLFASACRKPPHAPFPGNLAVAGALAARILKKSFNRLLDKNHFQQWMLLYSFDQKDKTGDLPTANGKFKQLVPPKDRFWADPCVVEHEGKHAVFIEECEYANNKGYLSVVTFDEHDNPVLPPVKILEKPHHLSYPFVFEDKGALYMVPESAENNAIALYKCRRFPTEWEFVMNLIEDIIAYDTTIWRHNGKYWLFATVCESREASSSDEVFLFSSDTLFSHQWQPHPCNPIVSDVRRARPAGAIFEHDGHWYRPAQDCSQRYGRAISIQRIDLIDEQSYSETPVRRIDAEWDDNINCVHTISRKGRLTFIDGMKRRRSLPNAESARRSFIHPVRSAAAWLSFQSRSNNVLKK